jgi:iron complex outermembrane receptor protein
VRRRENFTQLFLVNDTSGAATQVVIADPRQRVASRSWEGLLSIQPGGGVGHRFIIGLRGRGRQTETGGSDIRNFGPVTLGERDIEAKPAFVFGKLNVGSLLQTSLMAAYLGTFEGVGQVNLGVQRVRYRATFVTGAGQRSATESDPWLFNASVSIDLSRSVSLFVGTVRGLEDSGTAPETAANRNEQLPATRTRQYDGGLRWRIGRSELVLTAFEIVKPYFAFGTGNRWIETGAERHRGIEGSFVGHLAGDRLTILAGAVAMKPVVIGNPRELGAVGRRPAGTPSLYARADFNYRTDLLGSLTPTAAIVYTGRRAVGSQTFAELGERQPMLGAVTTVDIGLRDRFVIGSVPASVRLLVLNVFDRKGWKVIGGNTLQANDRRRLQLALAADF